MTAKRFCSAALLSLICLLTVGWIVMAYEDANKTPARTAVQKLLTDGNFTGAKKIFDEGGAPISKAWDKFSFPDFGDDKAFALEISNDGAAPVFRNGHIVVVSPSAELRKGDPVVIKNGDGCQVMRLTRQTTKKVELKSFSGQMEDHVLDRDDVEWMARIVWVRH